MDIVAKNVFHMMLLLFVGTGQGQRCNETLQITQQPSKCGESLWIQLSNPTAIPLKDISLVMIDAVASKVVSGYCLTITVSEKAVEFEYTCYKCDGATNQHAIVRLTTAVKTCDTNYVRIPSLQIAPSLLTSLAAPRTPPTKPHMIPTTRPWTSLVVPRTPPTKPHMIPTTRPWTSLVVPRTPPTKPHMIPTTRPWTSLVVPRTPPTKPHMIPTTRPWTSLVVPRTPPTKPHMIPTTRPWTSLVVPRTPPTKPHMIPTTRHRGVDALTNVDDSQPSVYVYPCGIAGLVVIVCITGVVLYKRRSREKTGGVVIVEMERSEDHVYAEVGPGTSQRTSGSGLTARPLATESHGNQSHVYETPRVSPQDTSTYEVLRNNGKAGSTLPPSGFVESPSNLYLTTCFTTQDDVASPSHLYLTPCFATQDDVASPSHLYLTPCFATQDDVASPSHLYLTPCFATQDDGIYSN